MISIKLFVDDAPLRDVADKARTLPTRFQGKVVAKMPRLKSQVLTITAVRPGPVVYAGPPSASGNPTLRWKSERQRRAFFASNGFGAGIPYERRAGPGDLLGAYDVTLDATDANGTITLTNSDPAAPFVVGEFQQPFHVDTGWLNVDTVQDQNVDAALNTIFDAWNEAVTEL